MTTPLWTGHALLHATQGRAIGTLPDSITGISIDSRTLMPGELYVAIKGDVHDGHAFVQAALGAGASAALVSERNLPEIGAASPLVSVSDSLDGLIALGNAARARSQAKIIAVTGSAGKTGTKDALGFVLSQQGQTHFSVASFNNHWGVPLTLARFPASCAYGVFEIGMNHAGEITPLVKMVRPHVAIVTTIAPVHLAHFSSTLAIADAKGEIFSGLEEGGTAIINGDIPEMDRLDQHARHAGVKNIVHFGAGDPCDIRLIDAILGESSSEVTADIFGQRVHYRIGSPGRHIVMNSLAVLAAVSCVGADISRAAADLADVKPPQGRGARIRLFLPDGTAELIDESYNANPASMRAAMENLGRIQTSGRRIAVLGDMLELGEDAANLHSGLREHLVANKIDQVFLAGPMMRHLWDVLPTSIRGRHAPTSQEILAAVRSEIRAGDIISVKGSLGSRMGPIVKALVKEFPADQEKNG